MRILNTENNYGIINILLHWLMALLIIGMLCLGLYMTGLVASPQKFKLYGWHKEVGTLILMLVILRVIWRIANIMPSLPTHLPYWQILAARVSHFALYFFMFALPITGWLMSSAAGFPVSFFGLFVLPDLIAPHEHLKHLLAEAHKWLAYGLITVICIHVLAALKHHFIDKDNILRRMLS